MSKEKDTYIEWTDAKVIKPKNDTLTKIEEHLRCLSLIKLLGVVDTLLDTEVEVSRYKNNIKQQLKFIANNTVKERR